MREAHKLNNAKYLAMADAYIMQTEEEDFREDWLDRYATTEILDAKYDNRFRGSREKSETFKPRPVRRLT